MTTTEGPIRASDAERDDIAWRIQSATAEGRLSLEEADERLSGVYASAFRHELTALVADLPAEVAARPDPTPEPRRAENDDRRGNRALAVHGVVVVVLAAILLTRWATSDVTYFWPMFPLFWLGLSLLVHARRRNSRQH